MTRLQMMRAKDVERLLFKLGFTKIRQAGSHIFYRHSDGRATVLPFHSGRDIARPLLRSILRDINIDIDAFNALLND